jgi:hypothetical protein
MENLIYLKDILQDEFLEAWEKEDSESNHLDEFMDKRRAEHAGYKGLRYYLATLTQEGYRNIVVSPSPGRLLPDVVSHYRLRDDHTDEFMRFQKIRRELNDAINISGSLEKSDYSLGRVFYPRELVVFDNPDYYRDFGEGKLYAGNRHRFIGFGLWVEEYGYQPAKVYFCARRFQTQERNTIARC